MTVVVLSRRLGAVLPVAAVPVLRAAERMLADATVPSEVTAVLDAVPLRPAPNVTLGSASEPNATLGTGDVLLTTDPGAPVPAAVLAQGAELVCTPEPAGAVLLDAVAVLDRLRSPGGCPWDAEQTHTSLMPYLIEETYELYQALEDGDRAALREELGDVLLQVLFHSRVAHEDPGAPFSIDDVARDLHAKLVGRHPHVFAGGAARVATAADQQLRWEELKRTEKQRGSAVDGVAFGQPAVALAAKLVARARRAGVPRELLPDGDSPGQRMFALAADAKLDGVDPEAELRTTARRFAAQLRTAEDAARAAGADPHALDAAAWRRYWPR